MQLSRFFDKSLYRMLLDIRRTEQVSRHGPYAAGSGKASLSQLKDTSKIIGSQAVALSNILRHHGVAALMVKYIEKYASEPDRLHDGLGEHSASCRCSKDEFRIILNALKQQIEGAAGTLKYLQERAQSQSSVVRANWFPLQ
jgi:hypothetical protein